MFFDLEPNSLPPGAQFYFNIMVIIVYFSNKAHLLPDNVQSCWVIDHITDARPYVIDFIRVNSLPEDELFEYEEYSHCVVEIDKNGEIGWYDMLDFECEGPWAIVPEFEDFDYEDEEDDE